MVLDMVSHEVEYKFNTQQLKDLIERIQEHPDWNIIFNPRYDGHHYLTVDFYHDGYEHGRCIIDHDKFDKITQS